MQVSVKARTSCSLVKIKKTLTSLTPFKCLGHSCSFTATYWPVKSLSTPSDSLHKLCYFWNLQYPLSFYGLCVNSTVSAVIDVWELIERERERENKGWAELESLMRAQSAFCSHIHTSEHTIVGRWDGNKMSVCDEEVMYWWRAYLRVSDKCQAQRLNAKECYSVRPANQLFFFFMF